MLNFDSRMSVGQSAHMARFISADYIHRAVDYIHRVEEDANAGEPRSSTPTETFTKPSWMMPSPTSSSTPHHTVIAIVINADTDSDSGTVINADTVRGQLHHLPLALHAVPFAAGDLTGPSESEQTPLPNVTIRSVPRVGVARGNVARW